jgi:uncharacterized protein (DUF1499 family)
VEAALTDSALATGRGHRIIGHAVQLASLLAAVAVLLLLAVPFGWRFGLWHFRTSFQMVGWAQDLAIAAAVVAALGLVFGRAAIGRVGRLLAAALVLFGVGLVYVPWQWAQLRGPRPPINDITTDSADPPDIVAALPARSAEQAVAATYGGAAIAQQQQQAAYGDIAPAMLALPPAQGFKRALAAAKAMGWTILASDPQKGTIEASDTTIYFGFTDDIVIRVTPEGVGSRIDIRSHSRQGRGDLGVNAARVRKYLAAVKG